MDDILDSVHTVQEAQELTTGIDNVLRLLAKRKQEEIEESLGPLTAQELEESGKYQAKMYRRACMVALRKTTSTC